MLVMLSLQQNQTMHKEYLRSKAFRWTIELAGSMKRLTINIALFLAIGAACLTSIKNSNAIIFLIGGVIPCIFNYCLYKLAHVCISKASDLKLVAGISTNRMKFFFWIDTLLILMLPSLIVFDILSSPIIKLISCPIIPIIQLLGMRGLLIFYLT